MSGRRRTGGRLSLNQVGPYVPSAVAKVTGIELSAELSTEEKDRKTHLLMVRIARSPRLIWGTPWSQPTRVSHTPPLVLFHPHTLNQTANTDGGSEGRAAVPGAVEPIDGTEISTAHVDTKGDNSRELT